jgi:hypothetical protein
MQCLLVGHGKMHYDVAAQTPAQVTRQCHVEVHLSHLIHAGRRRRPLHEQLLPPVSVSAGAKVASSALGRGLRLHDIMMEDAATGTLQMKTISRLCIASQ